MAKRGSGIYKVVQGRKVELSSKEVKAYIMKVNNWTSSEYRKNYDILKNKVYAYESYMRQGGAKFTKTSTAQLLYKTAKAKTLYGEDYKPSMQMRRIQSFSALSKTKGEQAVKKQRYIEKANKRQEDYLKDRFGGLIWGAENGSSRGNPIAQRIWNEIEDPVKREEALRDFADKLKVKITEEGKVSEDAPFEVGEVTGSDADIDFDITPYL